MPMKKYIDCVCGCSVVRMECDEWNTPVKYFYVSVFRHGNYTLTSRLRMMWKILRTGHPYGDDVVLEAKDAKSLANFIKSAMKR